MSALVWLLVLAVFVAWRWARRRRQSVLAGRDAERPTYAVQPPSRSVGVRRTETL